MPRRFCSALRPPAFLHGAVAVRAWSVGAGVVLLLWSAFSSSTYPFSRSVFLSTLSDPLPSYLLSHCRGSVDPAHSPRLSLLFFDSFLFCFAARVLPWVRLTVSHRFRPQHAFAWQSRLFPLRSATWQRRHVGPGHPRRLATWNLVSFLVGSAGYIAFHHLDFFAAPLPPHFCVCLRLHS